MSRLHRARLSRIIKRGLVHFLGRHAVGDRAHLLVDVVAPLAAGEDAEQHRRGHGRLRFELIANGRPQCRGGQILALIFGPKSSTPALTQINSHSPCDTGDERRPRYLD